MTGDARPTGMVILIHIALRWSAEIGRVAFYRHIAPLERKTEEFNLTVFCRDMNLDLQVERSAILIEVQTNAVLAFARDSSSSSSVSPKGDKPCSPRSDINVERGTPAS